MLLQTFRITLCFFIAGLLVDLSNIQAFGLGLDSSITLSSSFNLSDPTGKFYKFRKSEKDITCTEYKKQGSASVFDKPDVPQDFTEYLKAYRPDTWFGIDVSILNVIKFHSEIQPFSFLEPYFQDSEGRAQVISAIRSSTEGALKSSRSTAEQVLNRETTWLLNDDRYFPNNDKLYRLNKPLFELCLMLPFFADSKLSVGCGWSKINFAAQPSETSETVRSRIDQFGVAVRPIAAWQYKKLTVKCIFGNLVNADAEDNIVNHVRQREERSDLKYAIWGPLTITIQLSIFTITN